MNVDSLWTVWENQTLEDSIRLEAIYSISWDGFLFTNPDSAFGVAQLQYDFAKENNLPYYGALALNTQAVSFHLRGEYLKRSIITIKV